MKKESEEIKQLYQKLISSEPYKFTNKGTKTNVSDKQGVYVIYGPNERILYVGRTLRGDKGLNQRLDNHRTMASTFSKSYFKREEKRLDSSYSFRFLEVENSRKRALLEAYATGCLCPPYLGTGEKIN